MAGIEFLVPTALSERPFARLLLNYSQVLGRRRQCLRPTEMRYRWCNPSRLSPYRHYQVLAEGDFAELQAFCIELNPALYHYAQGVIANVPAYRRSLLPRVIPIAFLRAVLDLAEGIGKVTSRAAELSVPIVVNSFIFLLTGQQEIDRQLGALSQTLLQGRNRRISAGVVTEQLHTAAELVLKRTLGRPNKGSTFGGLVSAAEAAALISRSEASSLTTLKDMHRNAKHRGQSVSERRLLKVLPATVGVLHRLAATLTVRQEG